jgi:hypothetical protein
MWQPDGRYPRLENLETEFGTITLEPIVSDRGRWRCTSLLNGGYYERILNLIPLYYFHEAIAKEEIFSWLELAKTFVQSGSHSISIGFMAQKIYFGTYCMVTFGSVRITNEISAYYVAVTVPPDLEPWLVVDAHDEFPRFYLSPVWAQAEVETWLATRGQIQQGTNWITLP